MIPLLADENFNNKILRGLLLKDKATIITRVQDIGLSGASDPEILEWAAQNNWMLLTHDAETVPFFAYERITSGHKTTGIIIISQDAAAMNVIDDLLLITHCSKIEEWDNRVIYLPI